MLCKCVTIKMTDNLIEIMRAGQRKKIKKVDVDDNPLVICVKVIVYVIKCIS